jgi:hypothetical protein|tara:strand:+ start:41879 stop:42073 length:195 start_codon:yes stop_codon:yes gene_type:complete
MLAEGAANGAWQGNPPRGLDRIVAVDAISPAAAGQRGLDGLNAGSALLFEARVGQFIVTIAEMH